MPNLLKRILVTGASGLIGTALREAAAAHGSEITALVRNSRSTPRGAIFWNPEKLDYTIHPVQLEGFDAAIHLSGANVSRRWTRRYRQQIVESRVRSTQAISELLAEVRQRPRVLVCASAVGIYGDRGDEVLTESSGPGSGFLAETCIAWEAATAQAREAGIRVVPVRLGVVITPEGGALAKMLPAFRAGIGGRLGSGQQWMSWISLRDAIRAIYFALSCEDLSGPLNLTAPHPVTNREFTRALARAVHRPAILPVPRPALRLAFGRMADETLPRLPACSAAAP
jgi:uncharacterized protein (TIGR01777 family)